MSGLIKLNRSQLNLAMTGSEFYRAKDVDKTIAKSMKIIYRLVILAQDIMDHAPLDISYIDDTLNSGRDYMSEHEAGKLTHSQKVTKCNADKSQRYAEWENLEGEFETGDEQ